MSRILSDSNELNTVAESVSPLLEHVPLDIASQICHNVMRDLRYLQARGHLRSDREYHLTENFRIHYEYLEPRDETAALEIRHQVQLLSTRQRRDTDLHARPIYRLRANNTNDDSNYGTNFPTRLAFYLSRRPYAYHYAFHKAEDKLRPLSSLAQNSPTLHCHDLVKVIVRTAYDKFQKDMGIVRRLLRKLEAGSLWDEMDLKITFPRMVAQLVGCSPGTLRLANVYNIIAAKSYDILVDVLEIRNNHKAASANDPMRSTWLASLARHAGSLKNKLKKVEQELYRALLELFRPHRTTTG